jgi:hypothetical protein
MSAREELESIGGASALVAWADAHRTEHPDWYWEFETIMTYGTRAEVEQFTAAMVRTIRAWRRAMA